MMAGCVPMAVRMSARVVVPVVVVMLMTGMAVMSVVGTMRMGAGTVSVKG